MTCNRKCIHIFWFSLYLYLSLSFIFRLTVSPNFRWNDKVHGKTAEPFWIWVEDPDNDHMYHHEYFLLTRKQVISKETQEIVFTIPIFEPLPNQYLVRAISDRWIGRVEQVEKLSNAKITKYFQKLSSHRQNDCCVTLINQLKT